MLSDGGLQMLHDAYGAANASTPAFEAALSVSAGCGQLPRGSAAAACC